MNPQTFLAAVALIALVLVWVMLNASIAPTSLVELRP